MSACEKCGAIGVVGPLYDWHGQYLGQGCNLCGHIVKEGTGGDPMSGIASSLNTSHTRGAMATIGGSIGITGGTGAFGLAFARHLLEHHNPTRIVLISRDEVKHHKAMVALADGRVRSFVGDVRDPYRLRRAFEGCELVIHAAAMKRVPECESNPHEAAQTNIFGTINVVNAAIDAGVRLVIGLSTDKAASPANLYGATKLCGERLMIASNAYAPGRTAIACTRYGNVMGSTGSVVPVWREQAQRGHITVSAPDATRFAMSMAEAVALVELAIDRAQGGEVFLPKLRGLRLADLAAVVAPDARVTVTGLTPGEKMHEALVAPEDVPELYDAGDVYVLYPRVTPWRDAPLERQGVPVPADFRYTSDAVPRMTRAQIRAVIA
jgi:FlaA1/EpsC-like NDP-sugar epimerase